MFKRSAANRYPVMQVLAHVVLILLCLLILTPFVLMIMSSVTEEMTLLTGGYKLWPRKFGLEAYAYIFDRGETILRSYLMTMLVTVIGTTVSLLLTSFTAYPLSRRDYPRRRLFTFMVLFTLLFNGGLVPTYMFWTQIVGIKNTIFAYLMPNLMLKAMYVLLFKNYFATNIPMEIIEAAKIDGAKELRIFFKIVLPLALPILAAIGLLIGLDYWNDWQNGLYYVTKARLYTYQTLLNRMIKEINFLASAGNEYGNLSGAAIPSTSVRMAIATIGAVPILLIYPFFQKYFSKGLTIGAVKG